MATAYTSLLGLALPITGELSGTWGTTVNDEITALLDSAIAGTTSITADADITLSDTDGAANETRQAVILWNPAAGTTTRNITAPARSKAYIVINASGGTQSIVLRGAGPTTGVTIVQGEKAVCAWNGVDFTKISSTIANAAGSNTQVQFNNSGVLGGSANLTWSGTALAVTGNVGVGTASPAAKFQTNSTDGTIAIFRTTSGANNGRLNIDISDSAATAGFAVGGNSSFPAMTFANGGAERMRIDSSGNVGIGTSSPSSPLNVVSASSSLAIAINGRSSDSLGAMYFYANDGTTQYSTITASATEFRLSSVPAAAVQTFHTNGSERMRLDASGNLGIGTATPSSFALLTVENSSNARAGWFYVSAASSLSTPSVTFVKKDNNTTTSQVLANFYVNGSLTAQGQINANGASAAAFGSFSDRRLKENITDLPPQLANIMALRTVEFDYIESEGGGHQIGFIAQDVQQVYPDLVGEREDGMLTLTDLNKNDARLIKAIQEQQALITALTARITALETN
jgi:trimeric autotransporter adhesin